MKKLGLITSIVFVLVFIFGLSGCKKDLKTVDNSMAFDSLKLAETYYLNSDPKQPSCNLQVDFVYPKQYKDEKTLSKVQKLFIDKVLGSKYVDQTPENALQSYKNDYIENFEQFQKKLMETVPLEEDEIEDRADFSYYLKLKNSIPFNKNNIISLLVSSNVYEGGAHGSHPVNCYIFDLAKGSFITEHQIFTEDYKKPLSSILVNKIVEANNLTDPQKLIDNGYTGIEDIVPNNNFIVDEKGITYYFNEYEIAAYVVGITKVFIPYSELAPFLKKDSPIAALAGL